MVGDTWDWEEVSEEYTGGVGMKTGDFCPICGRGHLGYRCGPSSFINIEGKELIIPDYESFKCSVCGEEVLDHDLIVRNEEKWRHRLKGELG